MNAIEETLKEIEQRKQEFEDLATRLRQVFGLDKQPAGDGVPSNNSPREALRIGLEVISKSKRNYPGGKKTMTMGLGKRLAAVLPKLKSPFDMNDLQRALGDRKITANQCAKQLWYWERHKQHGVKLQTKGVSGVPSKYVRAVTNPAEIAPDKRAALEKKLSDAIKQRDHAQANGREQLVEIFQKTIDAVSKELGE